MCIKIGNFLRIVICVAIFLFTQSHSIAQEKMSHIAYFAGIQAVVPKVHINRNIIPGAPVQNGAGLVAYQQEVSKALRYAPHQDLEGLRNHALVYMRSLLERAQKHYKLFPRKLEGVIWTYLLVSNSAEAVPNCNWPFYITVNEIMFLHNHSTYMRYTLPHEVAHLISCQVTGDPDVAHTTSIWQDAMRYLAGAVVPTHNMSVYPSCVAYRNIVSAANYCKDCLSSYLPDCSESK